MVNLEKELENYHPVEIKTEDQGRNIPDYFNKSATLYNQALENLRAGSEDIAIIELKKAVSINPDFLEAMNLLGLAYCLTDNYSKAEDVFNKVIEKENHSVKALEYLKDIIEYDTEKTIVREKTPKLKKEKAKKEKAKKERVKKPVKDKKGKKEISSANLRIMNYVMGVVTGIALVVFLGFIYFFFIDTGSTPDTVKEDKTAGMVRKQADLEKTITEMEEQYEGKLQSKDNEINKLENDLEVARDSTQYLREVVRLYEVEKLFALEQYEQAADKFILLEPDVFTGNEKEIYNRILEKDMDKVKWSLYNKGLSLFKNEQYQEALSRFEKVQEYVNEWENMDWLMYHMGVCYNEINNSRKALEVFLEIKDKYPDSSAIQYVDNRINQITGKP